MNTQATASKFRDSYLNGVAAVGAIAVATAMSLLQIAMFLH